MKQKQKQSDYTDCGLYARPVTRNQMKLADDLNRLVWFCHDEAIQNFWWNDPETGLPIERTLGEALCLIHSEISEALEGGRKDLMDEHLPHRNSVEVELADAVIRICDLAGYLNLDLGRALIEKMDYNQRRDDHKPENRQKPGGKKF